MPKFYKLNDLINTFSVIEADDAVDAYYKAKQCAAHQPRILTEQEMRDLQDNIGHVLKESHEDQSL